MSPRGPPPTPDKLLQRNYGAIDCSPVGIRASALWIPAAGYVAPRVLDPGAALSPRLSYPKALYILLGLETIITYCYKKQQLLYLLLYCIFVCMYIFFVNTKI